MSLDGELEIAIYVHNFHNLDLFQQGWYGIRITCFWEGGNIQQRMGIPSRVVQYAVPDVAHGEASTFWRINDLDNSYHSRPFRIRHARQDVNLQEMVSFKLKVNHERPMDHAVVIQFEMLFAPLDKEVSKGQPPEVLPTVATHKFGIVGSAWPCLHSFCALTFDDWHFALVNVNVHTLLLSLSHNVLHSKQDASASQLADALETSSLQSSSAGTASDKDGSGASRANNKLPAGTPKSLDGSAGVGSRADAGGESIEGQVDAESESASSGLQREAGEANSAEDRPPEPDNLDLLHLLWTAKLKLRVELAGMYRAADLPELPPMEDSSVAGKLERAFASGENVSAIHGGEAGQNGERKEGGEEVGSKDDEALRREADMNLDDDVLSGEEWQTARTELTRDLAWLWNAFLQTHRQHQAIITELLRRRWDRCRFPEAELWVVNKDLPLAQDEVFGSADGDKIGFWRSPHNPLAKKPQEERAQLSVAAALLHRQKLVNSKFLHIPFQDMRYFANPAAQPVIFSELHTALPGGVPPGEEEGISAWRSTCVEKSLQPRKKEGRHVVVFVHGFQGSCLDLRLIRNHWMIMDKDVQCFMSGANEDRTFDSFEEMGHRLADEVAAYLATMFNRGLPNRRPLLSKLSFVGHSIGNLIIRAAVADDALAPYRRHLYTYLSLAGPHLGYLYSSNNVFNGGMWLLKRLKGAHVMHQLTLSDHPEIRDCYLYHLSQAKFFEYFTSVVLLSSPQDRYVPYHSARIEMCPAALKDLKKGGAYASMVEGCLAPLLRAAASNPKNFARCDVNFDVSAQAGSLNNMIGRKAHIDFLETDVYIRMCLWYFRDLFT